MATTPRSLTFEALDYIGVATIALASTRQLQRIARDLTAAMQLIYATAPALYKDRIGARVIGPRTLTLSVTPGSTAYTAASLTPANGNTILIANDPTYNEIASSTALRLPYAGPTAGSFTATTWNDCALLTGIGRVLGAARINDLHPLAKRNNRADAQRGPLYEPDYGRRLRYQSVAHAVGRPLCYWVETVLTAPSATTHASALRLRLYPMPDTVYTVSVDVRVLAPAYGTADLGSDSADSTATMVVAENMIDSIVRPIFLKQWSGSPWFRDTDGRKEIKTQYDQAMLLLQNYRPQQQSNRRITAPL